MSGVFVKVAADASEFSSTLGGLGEKFLSGLAGINPVVGGVIAAVGGIAAAAVSVAETWEDATHTLIAGTGASGDALAGLKDDWEAVFKSGDESAQVAAKAVADVNTALGLTGEPLQKVSRNFLDLAGIVGEDVNAVIKSSTQAFNDWKISGEAVATSQDYLLKVNQSTGISITELTGQLSQAGPTLRTLGLDFEHSATLIGQLSKAGPGASEAMAGLGKAVGKLTDAGVPAKGALDSIIGSIKNASTDSAAGAAAIEVFGIKAGPKLAEQIRAGKFDIDGLTDSLKANTTTINDIDNATDSFSAKLGELWNNLQPILVPLGTVLLDAGSELVLMFTDLVKGVSSGSTAFSGLLTFVQPLIDAFTNSVQPALQQVGTLLLGLGVTIVQGALIPALTFLWQNVLAPLSSFLVDVLAGTINTVYGALSGFLDVLKSIPGVSSLFEAGQKAINTVLGVGKTSADDAKTATDGLKGAHGALTDTLNKGTHPAITNVIGALGEKSKATDLAKKATSDLDSAETALQEGLKKLTLPVIKSVTDSQKDLDAARVKLKTSTDALRAAEDTLKSKVADTTTSSKTLKTAMDALDVAKKNVKTSSDGLTAAETNLKDSQKAAKDTSDELQRGLKELEKAVGDVTVAIPDMSAGLATIASVTKDLNAALEETATVKAAKVNAALKAMGMEPIGSLEALSDAAVKNFQIITDSGLASPGLIRESHICELQVIEDAYIAAGTSVPASNQLLLAALTQQEKDYRDNSVTQWATMWNSIHDSVADIFKTLNNDIVTGNWKGFKDHIIGDLQSIAEAVVTKFLKPAEDAIESFIANTLTNLLSGKGFGGVLTDLGKIGDSITGIFKTAAPAANTAVNAGTQAATTAANAGTQAANAGTSAASSGASSALSSVASVAGIVTGVITAGAGVYADAVLTNIKDCLNDMRNDTKFNSWVWDQGGGHEALLLIKSNIDNFVNGAFGGWFHDSLASLMSTTEDLAERSKDWLPAINSLTDRVTAKLDTLISTSSISVTVKAYIDGKEVASAVETQIENAVRLALA